MRDWKIFKKSYTARGERNIREQLMSLLGSALFFVLLVIGVGVIIFVYRSEVTAWRGRQGEAAAYATRSVETFLHHAQKMLTLTGTLQLQQIEENPALLKNILEHNQEILEIVRVGEKGRILASVYSDRPVLASLYTIPLSRWFMEGRAGKEYISTVQVSAGEKPYIIVAVPGFNGEVIAARVDMAVLWHVVREIRLGVNGNACVVNGEGQVISHTNNEIAEKNANIHTSSSLGKFFQNLQQENSGKYINLEGVPVVGVGVKISGTDWIVITELPLLEAYQNTWRALVLLGIGIVMISSLVVFATAKSLDRLILKPLLLMQDAATAIGAGNLTHRIHLKRGDEIGKVALAMDQMSEHLMAQQTALQESEQRYRLIAENSSDVIWVRGLDLKLTYISPSVYRLRGYTVEEAMAHQITETLTPESAERAVTALSEALHEVLKYGLQNRKHESLTLELETTHKNGSTIWTETQFSFLEGADGNPSGILGVTRDIRARKQAHDDLRRLNNELEMRVSERTAELERINQELQNEIIVRREAERALHQSEEYFRRLIEHASDIITLLDADGTIRYESPSIERVAGYAAPGLAGNNVFDYIHPEDLPKTLETFHKAKKSPGLALSLELRFRHCDGSWRILEAVGQNLLDDPIVSAVLVNSRDITERKRMEDDLRANELRLRRITENMLDVLVQTDGRGVITYASPSTTAVLGYSPDQMIGKSMFGLAHPDDLEPAFQIAKSAYETGSPTHLEYRYLHAEGHHVWMEAVGNILFDDQGCVSGSIITAREITARKKMEADLRFSEERFRQLAENIDDLFWLLDIETGKMIYVSPSYEAIYQDSRDSLYLNPWSWLEIVHPQDLEAVNLALQQQKHGEKPFDEEYRYIRKDHSVGWCWTRAFLIRNEQGRPYRVAGITKEISERKRSEEALQHRLTVETVVSRISSRLSRSSSTELDRDLEIVLEDIGQLIGADRVYVFQFTEDQTAMDNTHEWCRPGISAQIENLQGVACDMLPWWMEKLNRLEVIHIPSVAGLPEEAAAEKELLQAQNIQALEVVPLLFGSSLGGFLGFDIIQSTVTVSEDDILLLKVASEIIAYSLERRLTEIEINQRTMQLETLRQISLELTAQLNTKALLTSIVSQAVSLLGGVTGALYQYSQTQDCLQLDMVTGPISLPIGATLKKGEGLSGKVWLSGKPLMIENYSEWEGRSAQYENHKVFALLGVPIKIGDELIGVINVLGDEKKKFTHTDIELLSLFATHAAIAIKNASILESQEMQRQRAESIANVNAALSSTLDIDVMLTALIKAVVASIAVADRGAILLINDEAENFVVRAAMGFSGEDALTFSVPLTEWENTSLLREQKPLIMDEVETGFSWPPPGTTREDGTAYSALLAPLYYHNGTFGVLIVENLRRKEVFQKTDQDLVTVFARQAAIAIENANLHARVQRLASIDSLTGLYNRRYFFDAAQKEIERSARKKHPVSIIMFDIDRFKSVNDQYGHAVGDQVLKTVARRCREALREIDVVARYGGEEFVALLPETILEHATAVAERLRQRICDISVQTPLGLISISASFGVMTAADECIHLDTLLYCADQALYRSKQNGRNRVTVWSEEAKSLFQ